jgi:hypothetical protein
MNQNDTKLSRDELLQKLKNKKKQNQLHRMTKKNREGVLEKMESKAKLEQEEMMKQLKMCTPEQLRNFGLNEEQIQQILKKEESVENSQSNQPQPVVNTDKSEPDNMFEIPDIKIPKMAPPINAQIVNTI